MNLGMKIIRDRGFYKVVCCDGAKLYHKCYTLKEAQEWIARHDIKKVYGIEPYQFKIDVQSAMFIRLDNMNKLKEVKP